MNKSQVAYFHLLHSYGPLLGILKSQAFNSSKDALISTPLAPKYTSHTTYSQTNSK
jgi:hypothetical protein